MLSKYEVGVFSVGIVVGYFISELRRRRQKVNSRELDKRVNLLIAAKMGLVNPV